MCADRPIHGRRAPLACLVVVLLSLAACGGSSGSPTAGQASPTPAPPSAAPPSPVSNGHCAVTPGATAAATVKWNITVEGGNPTIKAGQAVAFVTAGHERPTVTEGMNGTAVANPCTDKTLLSANTPYVLTFDKPGVYHIFCRKEPGAMFTTIHVV